MEHNTIVVQNRMVLLERAQEKMQYKIRKSEVSAQKIREAREASK